MSKGETGTEISLIMIVLLLCVAAGYCEAGGLDDQNFWGMGIDLQEWGIEGDSQVGAFSSLFYKSDPVTGTAHPEFAFFDMTVYWEDLQGVDVLLVEFSVVSPWPISQTGLYCREVNGLPIGGSYFGSECIVSSGGVHRIQLSVPVNLVAMLVPGETYSWNVVVGHEGEDIESPVAYLVYRPTSD